MIRKNKRGVSGVITAVILIALVMAAASIVWVVVNNIIKERLEGSGSCIGLFEKVIINNQYTCYNPDTEEFQFSISIEDIDIDKVVVSIAGQGSSKSFEITNEEKEISGLGPYPSGIGAVKLPGKNAGLTYIVSSSAGVGWPDSVKIAPVVGGKQCSVSDTLEQIDNCAVFA